MSSVLIEQRITFSYFLIQLIDVDLRLRKVINVVINRGSIMAFALKCFPMNLPAVAGLSEKKAKSQLVIYYF